MSVYYGEDKAIGYITFNQPDSKVNVLSSPVIQQFEAILDSLKNKVLKALIIQSDKKDIFIAGADIKEIESITEVSDGKAKSMAGQRVLDKLEDLPFPTIAVIDGVALGGGCELALACRYRVATFNEKIRIGLPEVNLGFVPGFGGTYRLPRLVGLMQGLKLITSGAPINSQQAFKCGLVDVLYPSVNLSEHLKGFIAQVVTKPQGRIFPKKNFRGLDGFLNNSFTGQQLLFDQTHKAVFKVTKGFYPAPLNAVEVVCQTFNKSRARALDIESSAFAQLAVGQVSKNCVSVFYLSEKFKKLSMPDVDVKQLPPIHHVGVLGAGVMGGGIAQLLSNRDVTVRLKDINWDALAKGLKAAYDVYQGMVKKRKLKPHEVIHKMAKISTTIDYSGMMGADMVIEAVVENMDVKKKVLAELATKVSDQCIIASNTSSLSVTKMGQDLPHPQRVVGFHFFNPVHRMPLIEIIKTSQTSKEVVARSVEFAKKLGKTPIVVNDAPGFLVNRILLGYINEAGRILEEGSDIQAIDQWAMRFGLPMGPFTLSDEVGLDVGVKVLHVLHQGLGQRFKPVDIFEKVVAQGLLGKKTTKGFYLHQAQERRVNPVVMNMIKTGRCANYQEAIERMVYMMINEAAMILQEGVVESAEVVDIGMIMGTGFPAFRGGLLRYADAVGIAKVVASLDKFEKRFGDGRFVPCRLLVEKATQQQGFYHHGR